MSVIAEFSVAAESFALEQTFRELPDVTVEIERLATHSREWVMPFLWATDDDLDAFEVSLENDPSVEEATTIDTASGVGLYNVHWSDDVAELVDAIIDQHGIMLEAEASDGVWFLKLRFINREYLETFQRYFDEHGYGFDVRRIVSEDEPKRREYDLTPEQRETLVTALEVGYFDVPRETTTTELAEMLDISTNAASQRLRRASKALVSNTLSVTPDENRVPDE